MKSIYIVVFLMLTVLTGHAQTPNFFNYQAVVRNGVGEVIANQAVGVKISILSGSSGGPAVFSETHTPTTNAYGLINLQIGNGTNFGPQLSTINWETNSYFVRVEIDPNGGTTYMIASTSQLISVPYALHAKTVENNDDADADPTNEYNTGAVLNGMTLEITDGGGTFAVDLSSLENDADFNPTNEIQTISKVGNIITLSLGGGAITDDVNDADSSPTNELNTGISLVGTTLSITDAGGTQSVSLAPLAGDPSSTNELNTNANLVGTTLNITDAGGTLAVNLSSLVNDADANPANELNTNANLVGTNLNITDPGGTLTVNLASLINDADASPINELNTSATLVGTNLNITDPGGTLTVNLSSLVNDADASPTNELNTNANLIGTTLNITDAGGTLAVNLASLVNDADASPTNELNTNANLVGTTLNITDAGGTLAVNLSSLVNDADADPTNEIQTLSLVGSDLSISGGNTITLGGGTDSQTLSIVGNDLTISNGNTITLPSGGGTDSQTLSLVGTNLTIAGGNTIDVSSLVNDADASPTNELNTSATLVGTTLNITDAGGTLPVNLSSLVNDADADPANEIQTLSLVGSDLTISGGNTITLGGGTDSQTLSIVGNDLTISNGNTITLPSGGGTDSQTLSLVGSDLTILNGNTVSLPIQTHFIGEFFGGGIIVFVDSTGQHGLICALEDLPGQYLFELTPNSTVLHAPSFTNGATNTAALIAVTGDYPAAIACDAYTGGGFTDWYLPAAYEIELALMSNYLMREYALLRTNYYWSSTEDPTASGVNAFMVRNNYMNIQTTSEIAPIVANSHKVRPMRAF